MKKSTMSWLLLSALSQAQRARAFMLSSTTSKATTRGLSALRKAKKTVFIDGEAGTTGLQVRERLATHDGIEVVSLAPEDRKDTEKRREAINSVDAVVLCLPDDAAREAVSLIEEENDHTKVVDASTAHRNNPNWIYGFAEMSKMQREKIQKASRVANPGCYATGYLAVTRPLMDCGILNFMDRLTCFAVSGYSGGGKALCEVHENGAAEVEPYGLYGLDLDHKHLTEMRVYSRMDYAPVFSPAVGHFKQGMLVSIPLPFADGPRYHAALAEHYADSSFVNVAPLALQDLKGSLNRGAFLDPTALNGSNDLDLFVFHNPEQRNVLVTARLDNLGKGASGAAVQNLNLLLGLDEHLGVDLNNNHAAPAPTSPEEDDASSSS